MRAALVILVLAGTAHADGGITSQADLGATLLAGKDASAASAGPDFGAHLGYGPWRWLFLGALASASTHQATEMDGQYFQLYRLGGEVRFEVHAGQVGFALAPNAGIGWISTNVLDAAGVTTADQHSSLFYGGALSVEWQTENPRFAFGVSGDVAVFPDLTNLTTVSVNVFLRYTKSIW